jgi:hypothetical protein
MRAIDLNSKQKTRRGENKFDKGSILKVTKEENIKVATMDSHAPQAE